MKKLIRDFIYGEEGAELMEWAIGLVLAAALIVIAYTINDSVSGKVGNAADIIDDLP